MKRLKFTTDQGSVQFNGKAAAVIAILQLLDSAGTRGLKVPEMLTKLVDGAGVLMKGTTDEQHLSVLLQRLIRLGAVAHPPGPGNSRVYVLRSWPKILPG